MPDHRGHSREISEQVTVPDKTSRERPVHPCRYPGIRKGVILMMSKSRSGWLRRVSRVACVVAAAAMLSGCIVAPPGYYRPHYWYRY
jgi:hypothetical protein